MCHPDKGGCKDDMIIINNAYNYINPQLENKTDKKYEDLEKEFNDFCKKQNDKVIPFSMIYEESHDWIKEFNKEFDSKNKDNNPYKKGYGNLMDITENTLEYKSNLNTEVKKSFKHEIKEYKEPQSIDNQELLNVKEISDFWDNSKINMKDYYQAYCEENLRKKTI